MIRRFSPLVLTLALFATAGFGGAPAHGQVIMYSFDVDTSTLSGTSGSIEFQFNPTDASTLAATATITGFTGGIAGPFFDVIGGVAGDLLNPPVVIDNSTPLNDILQDVTFGPTLSFLVTLSGPGVATPNPGLPGSTFAMTIWNVSANDVLNNTNNPTAQFQVDPSGASALLTLNPDGTTTVVSAPQVTAAIPEPSPLLMGASALLALGYYNVRRRLGRCLGAA